jgi:hypothetical protein
MPKPEQKDVVIGGKFLDLAQARKNTNLDIEFGSGDTNDKLLELAKAKAPDPTVFDEYPPYFYFAEISNDLVNCYYLSFQKPVLESWVDTLKDGVQFQAFHQNNSPIGHSIYGWQENTGDRERVLGAFYAQPGIKLNQYMDNDSFIAAVKGGSLRDVSVGMFVDEVECNICGGDPTDAWGKFFGDCDCEHWLGEQYPITDDKGKETGETVTCIGLVNKGQLNEVSQVYDGGAPMAGIIPAMQLSRAQGLLDPRLQDRLESRFGISGVGDMSGIDFASDFSSAWLTPDQLKKIKKHVKASTQVSAKETHVTEKEPAVAEVEVRLADSLNDKQLTRLKELEVEVGDADGNFDFGILVESMTDKIVDLIDDVKTLEADAKIGRDYKAEKIDDTVAAGIRAKGNDWNADGYRKMLERCTIDEVKMFLSDLTAEGDAKFANPEGDSSRKTTGGDSVEEVTVDTGKSKKQFNDPRFKS